MSRTVIIWKLPSAHRSSCGMSKSSTGDFVLRRPLHSPCWAISPSLYLPREMSISLSLIKDGDYCPGCGKELERSPGPWTPLSRECPWKFEKRDSSQRLAGAD